MISKPRLALSAMVVVSLLATGRSATAQITPEQRQDLTQLKRDLAKVPGMLRVKDFDEAEEALSAAETKLEEIAEAVGVEPTDRMMQGVSVIISRHRNALELQQSRASGRGNDGVSFTKEVAPIIADNCLGCHGANNPRGNLRLDTFAGWKRGGQNGRLLTAGRSTGSLIMARLTAPNAAFPNPNQRMPRGQNALGNAELQTISNWINQGAKFDGDSEDTALSDLAAMEEDDPSIIIPKPTGNETVSFTRDIAPFMANLCVGCHSGNNLNGGLSLVSFYDMMKGGDSGRVVLPGNVNGSRLYRLVGGLENPRMPQGQARITRKNYEDLTKWFEEGNTFDGDNPREPLRNFVTSTAEMEADRFAQMSVEEFNKFRIDRTEAQMKKALPNDAFTTLQSDEFLLIGNVGAARLRTVDEWAQEQARALRQTFRAAGSDQLWKGRLAIFVLKDRFSFEEFSLEIAGIQAPEEMTGHSLVSNNYEDAYIAFQDVGDESTPEQPSSRVMLIDHLTGAYLKRGGGSLPDWVIRGTGLALAAKSLRGDAYLRGLDVLAAQQVGALNRPEDVFADGTFSPGTIGPVGFSLVNYMLSAGSDKFGEFIGLLAQGRDAAAAARQVYNTDLSALARGYLASVRR